MVSEYTSLSSYLMYTISNSTDISTSDKNQFGVPFKVCTKQVWPYLYPGDWLGVIDRWIKGNGVLLHVCGTVQAIMQVSMFGVI